MRKTKTRRELKLYPEICDLSPEAPDRPFGPEILWWKEDWTIIGTDEVGRGPIAGPVVAAAVAFDSKARIAGIRDSKKLSPERREELETEILRTALAWAVEEVDHERIDEINILQAAREAMQKAVERVAAALGKRFAANTSDSLLGVFVDGRIPPLGVGHQVNLVKGDDRSFTIGAASILAKVHRDKIMVEYDARYPGYGFAAHKGYCARRHVAAIRRLGRCPIHRASFHVRELAEK